MTEKLFYNQQKVTEIMDNKFNYSWKLKRSNVWNGNLRSENFTLGRGTQNLDFCFHKDDTSISVALEVSKIHLYNNLKVKASLVNRKGEKIISDSIRDIEKSYMGQKGRYKYTILELENSDVINESADDLTVICEISYLSQVDYNLNSPTTTNDLLSNTLDIFERQFEAEKYCDLTLVAPCKKNLRAHKFVLAAHSPVFAALLETDMKEKKEGVIQIEDIEYNALKEMLRFMYCAKVNNLEELSVEVMEAAEKYQIDGLRNVCLDYIFKNITVNNAAKALNLSYRLNLTDLRKKTMKFIRIKAEEVFITEGYKSLNKDSLASEIIRALAEE